MHLLLFVVTLISTAFTGGQFVGRILLYEEANVLFSLLGLPISWPFILDGLSFALSLLFFLTVHEFGHYFAARYHSISTSLPYYIPAPLIGIGTFGAVIRIREPIPSLRKLFDIGAAGPLAGFAVALGVLIYALATLPPPEYLLDQGGHEALKAYIEQYGRFPEAMPEAASPAEAGNRLVVGHTPLYWLLTRFFDHVPPMYEMYHYPFLFAGWLGLLFTALNLLPIGQLDGGHILYALVGPEWHLRLARGFVIMLLLSASIGYAKDIVPLLADSFPAAQAVAWFVLAGVLYFFLSRVFKGDHRLIAPALLGLMACTVLAQLVGPLAMEFGYYGWFFWCLLIVLFIRIEHPPVLYYQPLTPTRRALGTLSILIFFLCFSIKPFYFV